MKKKSFFLLCIMVAVVAAVAYFLFDVYDKKETLQEKLPLGLVIIAGTAVMAFLFYHLDKAFQRSLK